MNAFEGKLKTLMRMQATLKQMKVEMQQAAIHDEALNLNFDCMDSYNKIASEIEIALTAMVFDYNGTFDLKTGLLIENKINERTQKLSEIIKKSEAIVSDFNAKKKDYNSFIDYNLFVKNAEASLEKFKTDSNENIGEYFAKDNPVLVEETKTKYNTIVYELETKNFTWGFDKLADAEKNVIINHVLEKENLIRDIRQELLDKVIASGTNQKISTNLKKKPDKPSDEINNISKKIELLINNCNDKTTSDNYSTQFNKIKESESMDDLFFYQELHDRILENETTRKNKLFINDIIVNLNAIHTVDSLNQDKNFLLQKALKLLNNTKIRENEVNDIKKENELFFKNSRLAAEEIEIKKKEQLFIKSQIILNFENLGYEVMDDIKVIDFEKENDFYLKAPGQENLLNIKFKEDGSFRYVFQIPGKKDELSVDEQKIKLHEMKTTCEDFAAVLNDLKKMGVAIDVKSEKPVELSSMITIPESVSIRLNTPLKQSQRKQQIKKLYLE